MAGKECVAVAIDKRFGSGPQLVTIAPRHVYIPPTTTSTTTTTMGSNSRTMIAFVGMDGDVQSLSQEISTQLLSKVGRGAAMMLTMGSSSSSGGGGGGGGGTTLSSSSSATTTTNLTPKSLASLTSHLLYRRRQSPYFVEPVVVGLTTRRRRRKTTTTTTTKSSDSPSSDSSNVEYYEPFLCSMDLLGAKSYSNTFVVGGAASQSLYGTAQALYRPNLEPNDLVQICGKAFQSALERDCLSGYGILVLLLTKDGQITEYDIASRND